MRSRVRYEQPDDAANEVSGKVIDAAIAVHRVLGPGLLERVYHVCLAEELRYRGHDVAEEVHLPVVWRGRRLEVGYRADLVVDHRVVVEVKAVHALPAACRAQVLTYLRQSGCPIGLILNFHEARLVAGLERLTRPIIEEPNEVASVSAR